MNRAFIHVHARNQEYINTKVIPYLAGTPYYTVPRMDQVMHRRDFQKIRVLLLDETMGVGYQTIMNCIAWVLASPVYFMENSTDYNRISPADPAECDGVEEGVDGIINDLLLAAKEVPEVTDLCDLLENMSCD